jgi:hypothetical protein
MPSRRQATNERQSSAAKAPPHLDAIIANLTRRPLALTDISMTTTNPLSFHHSFFDQECQHGGLMPGKNCGSPTPIQPRSHHLNDIPTTLKTLGCSPKHCGTPARRSSPFVAAPLMCGSPHPGLVIVAKERVCSTQLSISVEECSAGTTPGVHQGRASLLL